MTKKKKPLRTKGKLPFSRAFQEFKKGDFVAVDVERSVVFNFPEKLQGRTGFVDGKTGRDYRVKINDCTMQKEYIINPIHLKKINSVVKNK